MRILMVDDDALVETLKVELAAEGFVVDAVRDSISSVWAATESDYERSLLEITIPPLGTNLLLHGAVKVAIVIALLIGSRCVYPWAMAALAAFVLFQGYELATAPILGVAALTVLDIFIIWLTWHEWHQDRELRDSSRGTITWVFRRHPPQTANQTRADTDRGCSDE